jgi:hypothetical protein
MADEPLLAAGGVKLFGQKVVGLDIDLGKASSGLAGLPQKLTKAMAAPTLARIYGFSYEGRYYEMARPAIFLVEGNGTAVDKTMATTGAASRTPAPREGLTMWPADQGDISLRLDIDIGPLERILLEAELGPDQQRLAMAGQSARLDYSGQSVRLRYAGQSARLRGGSGGTSD